MKRSVKFKAILFFTILSVCIACNSDNESGTTESFLLSPVTAGADTPSETISDQWFGFYFKGFKVGYIHSVITKKDSGFFGYSKGFVKIDTGTGSTQETMVEESVNVDKNYHMLAFTYKIETGSNSISISGKRSGDYLKTVLDAGGTKKETVEKVSEKLFMPISADLKFLNEGIIEGEKHSYNVYFQPAAKISTMKVHVQGEKEIDINGIKQKAFRVTEEIGGMKSVLWVTSKGKKIREESFEGFEIIAESRENAQDIKKGISFFDIVKQAGIRTDRNIPDSSKVTGAELKFEGLGENAQIPEREGQHIISITRGRNGNEIVVEARNKSLKNLSPLSLPVKYYRNYLKKTQFIQSDNSEIRNVADSIIEVSNNDSLIFVKETLRWFKDNIRPAVKENFSALDTLKSGEGECQSHSYLFCAIMRAGNVPCRIVSGLVYPEGYGQFMYHAWCEVYIGEWVSVDPSLKQFPADATHIVLAEGDIFSQVKIVNFLKNSGIKIIRVDYD